MSRVHPHSQDEADRVFPPEDRAEAAKRYAPHARNVKRRYERAERNAAAAIEAWFSPLGSVADVIDYERAAERQQLIALELHGAEARMRSLLG